MAKRNGRTWVGMMVLGILLSACVAVPPGGAPPGSAGGPTPALPPALSVADLARNPPAAGVDVEIDAYYDGNPPVAMFDMRRNDPCPLDYEATLTDQPLQGSVSILNARGGNGPPDGTPWLLVVALNDPTRSLPYHARLRGHLGEPAFAACQPADHVFAVTAIVAVYAEQAPDWTDGWGPQTPAAQRSDWSVYHDPVLGYRFPHPSAWTAAPLAESGLLGGVVLRDARWPDSPVTVRVHAGEIRWNPYGPTPVVTPAAVELADAYKQYLGPGDACSGLVGVHARRRFGADDVEEAILFAARGRTYEVTIRFHSMGFNVPQPVMSAYGSIVNAFALDEAPAITPCPATAVPHATGTFGPPAPSPNPDPRPTPAPAPWNSPVPYP